MFGVIMRKDGVERKFMPKTDLTYTMVDVDGKEYSTMRMDRYIFPMHEDGTVLGGFDLFTGEQVYVWDTHRNERATVFWQVLTGTYRYVLEHKMPRNVSISKFEVAEAM